MTELIVALDHHDLGDAQALAKSIGDRASAFKVGHTLFTAHGPEAILEIAQHGRVFCDLKLHDIPNQVTGSAAELTRLGVWMFTVHASGGAEMVAAAVRAAKAGTPPALVAAVTVLTSLSADALEGVGQGEKVQEQVLRLATLAVDAGATALVCSPQEVALLRERFPTGPKLVVPGVRPPGSETGDQARVATPREAAQAGADFIVVGRPITGATEPLAVVEAVLEELR
ncbi:MAG TPA: orotidine-5'-phosphate decarboxylase [Actinomycetota bacterium]|nr:orotidine-5'-phosphate decarboxylase [Actinomycetota bacterium]